MCRVGPASLPELTRVITAGALRNLEIYNGGGEMFDEADDESTRLFVAAVRASAMTRLQVLHVGVLPEIVQEAAAFINARQQAFLDRRLSSLTTLMTVAHGR